MTVELCKSLEPLGWTQEWSTALKVHGQPGWVAGRVIRDGQRSCVVHIGHEIVSATATGRFLREHTSRQAHPKVGDWVLLQKVPGEDKGLVHKVLPRRTHIRRKAVGRESGSQVLAANVDVALIIQGLDQPLNQRRLERFLVMAHEGGVAPVIVLNKVDLCANPKAFIEQARQIGGSIPVLTVSATDPKDSGILDLQSLLLPSKTHALLGTSGVGKSSLINRFFNEEIQLTLDVREQDRRGRHATTARELFMLPCGSLVMDTPGMRELHVWDVPASLEEAFPDIQQLGQLCRYRDCGHDKEPECAVQQAIQAGTLARARQEGYLKLKGELNALQQTHRYTRRRSLARPRPGADPDDLP